MEYVQIQKRKFVRCFGFTNEIVVVIIQSRYENDSTLKRNEENKIYVRN